jgi:hypothetical protein
VNSESRIESVDKKNSLILTSAEFLPDSVIDMDSDSSTHHENKGVNGAGNMADTIEEEEADMAPDRLMKQGNEEISGALLLSSLGLEGGEKREHVSLQLGNKDFYDVRPFLLICVTQKVLCFDGLVYQGEVLDGLMDGHGLYKFADGNRYVGEWRAGKKHGSGQFTWFNGVRPNTCLVFIHVNTTSRKRERKSRCNLMRTLTLSEILTSKNDSLPYHVCMLVRELSVSDLSSSSLTINTAGHLRRRLARWQDEWERKDRSER